MMQASGGPMGRATLKMVVSLGVAAAIGLGVMILLEALLPGTQAANAVLFRFQLSSMIAMAVFAGLAILIYVRLSRSSLERTRKK